MLAIGIIFARYQMDKLVFDSNIRRPYTFISNNFIDNFMPEASGEYTKVYLCLIRCLQDSKSGISLDEMATKFNLNNSDIMRALHYWDSKKVISLRSSQDCQTSIISLCDLDSMVEDASKASRLDLDSVTNLNSMTDIDSMTQFETMTELESMTDIDSLSKLNSIEKAQVASSISAPRQFDRDKELQNLNFSTDINAFLDKEDSIDTQSSSKVRVASKAQVAGKAQNSLNSQDITRAQESLSNDKDSSLELDKPHYTPSNITDKTIDDEDFFMIIKTIDNMLGPKPNLHTYHENVAFYYDFFKFSSELIVELFDYCLELEKLSPAYIDKVARDWHSKGILSVTQAKEEIKSHKLHSKAYYTILKEFGIRNRSTTPSEETFISKWLIDYQMPNGLIIEACKRSMKKTSGINCFEYADSIIEDWHKKAITSMEDVIKNDENHKKNQDAAFFKGKNAHTQNDRVNTYNQKKNYASKNKADYFNDYKQRDYDPVALKQQIFSSVYLNKAASAQSQSDQSGLDKNDVDKSGLDTLGLDTPDLDVHGLNIHGVDNTAISDNPNIANNLNNFDK